MKLFEKQRCESAFILLYADVDQAFKKNMYPDSDFMSQNDAFWKKHFVVFNY